MTEQTPPKKRRSLSSAITAFVIGGILIVIELSQGAPLRGAIGGFAILIAYGFAVWFFQNRSDTVSVLAGRPVDERWTLINTQALAIAATAAALFALGGYAVMELQGKENWQFALMCCVIAIGYIVGLVWHRWRS